MGAVHWGTLMRVVWTSFAAGLFMSAVFSLVILASARSGGRQPRGAGAAPRSASAPWPRSRCSSSAPGSRSAST